MIRLGAYDAFDKWEMLCRWWADRASVEDPFVDKWGRPTLPEWEQYALAGGRSACSEYLHLRSFAAADGGEFGSEVVRLLQHIGSARSDALVEELAQRAVREGFPVRFDDELSAITARLHEVFKIGALRLLQWTEDRAEVPGIDEVRRMRGRFPTAAIAHKRKVLSLFCAAFCGRNDVINIYDISPDEATLVDCDTNFMADMELIYPNSWNYICTEYKNVLSDAAASGRRFDLVVADPPLPYAREAAWEMLPTVMGICTDSFITNYATEMFAELGASADDLDAMSQAIAAKTGVDVAVAEVMQRNSTVSWVVLRSR